MLTLTLLLGVNSEGDKKDFILWNHYTQRWAAYTIKAMLSDDIYRVCIAGVKLYQTVRWRVDIICLRKIKRERIWLAVVKVGINKFKIGILCPR